MSLRTFVGDPEALKCCVVAIVSKVGAPALMPRESGYRTSFTPKDGNGSNLLDGNAIARYFALKNSSSGLLPAGYAGSQVERWIDAEEKVRHHIRSELLQCFSTEDYAAAVKAFLDSVNATLEKSTFLVGSSLTLADIVVFCTLFVGFLPNQGEEDDFKPWNTDGKYPAVSAWVDRLNEMESVQKAMKHAGCTSFDVVMTAVAFEPSTQDFSCSGPIPLPIHGKRNVLVTSALPYVNNVPHLGNIIGCVLSADVYARYCRLKGHNMVYVCGTDEYGTATETKALEEGLTPRQICDKYNKLHDQIYKWFDIDFDMFGRTSTEKQTHIAQDIFHKIVKQKCTLEDSMEQLYCLTCKKFLADRFVIGTCPHCKFDDARGDQCDGCGKLLNPTELVEPKCKVCKQVPEKRTTNHIFIDLPKLSERLEAFIDKKSVEGAWSYNSIQTTRTWLRDGLKPRCITRDLKWGTPVPMEKYKDKVFYVWFDAPIGYISITANLTDDWEMWWKNPEDVQLYQFMGKDNIPFHTIIFPSTLLGANDGYTLLHHISVTEYLNYEDGKFSKSRGVGVFGDNARDTGINSEVFRYYLMANRPETSDSVFSWTELQQRNNSELLANLGNYVNRALSFTSSRFAGEVPALQLTESDRTTIFQINRLLRKYITNMEKVNLKRGLEIAMQISSVGNVYMQDNKPWVVFKENKEACGSILNVALNITFLLAGILQPFIPGFSRKVLEQMNMEKVAIHDTFHFDVPAGHKLGKPAVIFRNIETAEVEDLRKRFGSKEDEFALDLKCGKVASVENHPDADKLYVLKVDVGNNKTVQVCAGLREVFPADYILGRNVVIVMNLKVTKMRGVASEGMMLCADEAGKLNILNSEGIAVGTQVIPEGCTFAPKKVVDKKEFGNIKMATGPDGQCFFKEFRLKAGDKYISVPSEVKAGSTIR